MSDGMKKIYLSGPMTGLKDLNYPRFNAVAAKLRGQGHEVYNPAEFEHPGRPFPLREAFAEYSNKICLWADTIVMLEGWEASRGAGVEISLAKACGLKVEMWVDGES